MSPIPTCRIRIQRYLPEQQPEPYWQDFEVPFAQDTSVLDALHHIKEELDASLSYRWSCRMAICGSCGLMIDGFPKLACHTFLRDYPQGLTLEPLAHFPLEKDLMADLSPFLEHLAAIQPYLIRTHPADFDAPEPFRQTPLELNRYKAWASCINCGLCYSACPQFGLNPAFVGPAALVLAQRYHQDSRDQGLSARLPVLNSPEGVWSCTFVGFCSTVCPQQLDPAAGVNQGKVTAARETLLRLLRWEQ